MESYHKKYYQMNKERLKKKSALQKQLTRNNDWFSDSLRIINAWVLLLGY